MVDSGALSFKVRKPCCTGIGRGRSRRRRRSFRLAAPLLCVFAGCTYNEYNTFAEGGGLAVETGSGGRAGGQGGSSTAGRGGSSGSAGAGGTAVGGSGGESAAQGCTGCLRLSVPPNEATDTRLEFDAEQDLANTTIVWRVRVRDFIGDVYFLTYAQSGDDAVDEFILGNVSVTTAAGWQDIGFDMGELPAFSPPTFIDAGGAAGGGFDAGFTFDKSEVERIGVRIQPAAQEGVFTPVSVEIDALTFSDRAALNVTLASDDGGIEVVGEGAATSVHVAQ